MAELSRSGMKQRKGAAEMDEDAGAGKHLEYRHKAQSFIDSKALDELEAEVFETGLYENQDLAKGSSFGVMAAEIVFSESTGAVLQLQWGVLKD